MLIAKLKQILELAKGLAEDMKKIQDLNTQLKDDLEHVEKTWQDDSFIEVRDYVNKIHKAVEERGDNVGHVVQELVQYVDALSKTM